MIDPEDITRFITSCLEGSPYFIVEVRVSPSNDVVVEIDGPDGVDIDACVELSREFEQHFSRDDEDYSLEIGGAGLTAPFKVQAQYEKNLGKEVETLVADGRKLRGVLRDVSAEAITLEYPVKKRVEGKKKPVMELCSEQIPMNKVLRTSLYIDF